MIKRSCFTSIIAGFVSLLVLAESAPADLANGEFIDNLSPWIVSPLIVGGDNGVVWIDGDGDHDGEAKFIPDDLESYANSTLSQMITVVSEFPILSFDVLMDTGDHPETDIFTASLNNGVPFYTLSSDDPRIVGGVFAETFTYDVSSFIGLVELEFNLAHDYINDDSETTVRLDNVALVPVPGALVLGSIGLSLAGCWLGKRRTL